MWETCVRVAGVPRQEVASAALRPAGPGGHRVGDPLRARGALRPPPAQGTLHRRREHAHRSVALEGRWGYGQGVGGRKSQTQGTGDPGELLRREMGTEYGNRMLLLSVERVQWEWCFRQVFTLPTDNNDHTIPYQCDLPLVNVKYFPSYSVILVCRLLVSQSFAVDKTMKIAVI